MKQLGISLLLCIGGVSAKAQFAGQPPAVYFNRLKATTVSDPAILPGRCLGWTIADPSWNRSIQFLMPNSIHPYFYARTNTGSLPFVLTRINARQDRLEIIQGSSTDKTVRTAYLIGSWGILTNNGIGWQGAKTISWSSHNMALGGPEIISGTLVLDTADTFSQAPGATVDSVATTFYNTLTNALLIQITDPTQ